MIVDGYQTLEDKDNIDHIESEGPFVCRRPGAWLGIGYYFWDTNMEWAIAWGVNSYEAYGKEFVIAKCQLDLTNNCFDLFGNVKHQIDFKEIIEVMLEADLIKNMNEAIVPNVIQFLKNKNLFQYKSIRAADMHNSKLKFFFKSHKPDFMIINQRVQICVVEKKDVLLRPFSVIYPEFYIN